MRSRLSLRARVAAAAAIAIVVAVALLGVAVSTLLAAQLTRTLDRSLRSRAVEVARVAAATPDLLTEPGALEGRITGGALFVQVVDRRGRIVARSGGLGGRVLPGGAAVEAALRARRAGYADGALGSEPIRVYAAPLGELGGGAAAGGAVIVAGTTADIDDTLQTTRRIILVCALVAAALAALLATLLTRRALRPVRSLSSGARAIERSGNASERLPAPASRDEVGELAQTLNAMLASLERARSAEQRFVADASHELRTPLTALRGNAAYVARHGADPAVLADIAADATRLSALLDDLLALAREDAAAPAGGEPVALELV
ncbi:MAG: two-component system, OmpR family, sensor kinase, partial [Solirubrobacteraceae bacterium]|nr:two-component system, OmpR family, sensor kinase [Solirubrobacteraceae bacterium]